MENLLACAAIVLLSALVFVRPSAASELKAEQAVSGKANIGSVPVGSGQTKATSPVVEDLSKLSVIKYLSNLKLDGWSIAWSYSGPFRMDQASYNIISPDLLQEYRCLMQSKQILQRGTRKIIIDAFQLATADGAYGTYCSARRGSSSYSTLGDASSEDQESTSFCKGPYFFCLQSTEQDDDEAKTAINTLTKKLIDHIELIEKGKQDDGVKPGANQNQIVDYGGKPKIFSLMPSMQRVRGSEKLIMGPVGMRRFFPAPYSANLMPFVEGSVADYRLEEPRRDRLKLLIAYYPTAQAASSAYGNYTATLAGQNKEKSVEGFTCPTTLFKIADCFLLCQLRDKQVIVINGARHKETLGELAHQIYF